MMEAYDINGDGGISVEEFEEACERTPAIFQALERALAMVMHMDCLTACQNLCNVFTG